MSAARPVGLGPADVLTPAEAVAALRVAEADGHAWLKEEGLVVTVVGRPRVIWGDVLERIRTGAIPSSVRKGAKPRSSTLPRERLG